MTLCCYACSLLPIVLGIVVAAVATQVFIVLGGLIVGGSRRNSLFLMTSMTGASAYFAFANSAARYAAWFFFAVLLGNGLAWIIMLLLRNSVGKLEQQCEP